jgi:hypothetical protein
MVVAIPSRSYSIFIAFTSINWEKTVNKVDASVAFINQDRNIVQLLDLGVGKSRFCHYFKVASWNNIFEKEFPKIQVPLGCHLSSSLETINVNISFGPIFNHLHNCPINIT